MALGTRLASVVHYHVINRFTIVVRTFSIFVISFQRVTSSINRHQAMEVMAAFVTFGFSAQGAMLVSNGTDCLCFNRIDFRQGENRAI